MKKTKGKNLITVFRKICYKESIVLCPMSGRGSWTSNNGLGLDCIKGDLDYILIMRVIKQTSKGCGFSVIGNKWRLGKHFSGTV